MWWTTVLCLPAKRRDGLVMLSVLQLGGAASSFVCVAALYEIFSCTFQRVASRPEALGAAEGASFSGIILDSHCTTGVVHSSHVDL